jgi:hypothetical protein
MIDWDRFAARVPAGTRVRFQYDEHSPLREGVLLENYPYRMEERIADIDDEKREGWVKELRSVHPTFRFQGYNERTWDNFGVKYGEFFIDGVWLTFQQVMQGDIPRAEG